MNEPTTVGPRHDPREIEESLRAEVESLGRIVDQQERTIAALNRAARAALSDPVIASRLKESGLDLPAEDRRTPEALAAHQAAEIARWWPIIKAANVKGQ